MKLLKLKTKNSNRNWIPRIFQSTKYRIRRAHEALIREKEKFLVDQVRNPESHTNYAFKVAVLEDTVTELKTEIKRLTGKLNDLNKIKDIEITQRIEIEDLKEALKLANEQVRCSDLRVVELNKRLQEAHKLVMELRQETPEHGIN